MADTGMSSNEAATASDLNSTVLHAALGDGAPGDDAGDRDIIDEAKERFKRCADWESQTRQRWLDDYKFSEGDSDNQYQWPNEIRRSRDVDERPCLTINKTRQHCLQIINDAKQNKPGIKVRATGGGSTVDSARVYNAIMRHIEYVSKAQVAYDTATSFQVKCGLGYIRLITDYEDDNSLNQLPFIRRVADPLMIYVDPSAVEADKSDMKFAFIYEDIDQEEFERVWPQYKGAMHNQGLDDAWGWKRDKTVRLAEYFRVVETPDMLYSVPNPPGDPTIFRESTFKKGPELLDKLKLLPGVRSRHTRIKVVEWYLLVGQKIVERNVWPGKYIPIIPVIGEETVIEGRVDRKGHTRALRDPQRMYNYMSSVAVEYSALQSKSPYVAPMEAIEGFETYWREANKTNYSYLPYNAMSDDGQIIPPPQRQPPPVSMPAAIQGMQTALAEMMIASGQYEADFGQQGNERSAKAINARERNSTTATFHYVDNLAIAVRAVGVQLLDLIPKLFDSRRVMNILAEDGTSLEVMLDPNAQQAALIHARADAMAAQAIFNPNVGKYDVQADVGPDWGSRRQETFNALQLILTQAPQLTGLIGDLLLQSSEFELAEEAAARLRRMVPPQALGTGPTPEVMQLMEQNKGLTRLLGTTMQQLVESQIKLKGKDQLRDVEAYKAISQRIAALVQAKGESPLESKDIDALMDEVRQASAKVSLEPVVAASDEALRSQSLSARAGQGGAQLPLFNGMQGGGGAPNAQQ